MIKEIQQKLKAKEITCTQLVDEYLKRIEELNPKLNAYITVDSAGAREKAKEIDEQIESSGNIDELFKDHPLLGIPIALKDIYSTKGIQTTAASNILKGYIPQYDATAVKNLKEAGTVILGKLNCDAFAHGADGSNSDFGSVKNPYDLERTSGGSSSGSGASVASDLTVISTGTDTGGSLRNPASMTNTVAIKPTYGRVSRYGIISMASSLDTIGHVGKTVEDVAKVLEVTAGEDKFDATTSSDSNTDYTKDLTKSVKGTKIGIPKEYFEGDLNSEVEKAVENSIEVYKNLGAEFVEVSLPHTKYAIAVYYLIVPAEISSNLARFDGIRYGRERDKFGAEAKRRIMIGTYALSAGFYDEYYGKAQKVRTLIIEDFKKAFKKVDALIAPVLPDLPWKLDEKIDDPMKLYQMDIFTCPANLAGVPALSVPAGFSKSGLPIGLQLLGKHFDEELLFKLGSALEGELKLYEK